MRHDISFKRDGRAVVVSIATDLPHDGAAECYIIFRNEYGNEAEAELRLRYFRQRHIAVIKQIREAEFSAGWKHAKAKKNGRSFFNWFMPSMKTEATHK